MLKKAFSLVLAGILAVGLALPAMAASNSSDDPYPEVKEIQLGNGSIRLEVNDYIPLVVHFLPRGSGEPVEWYSSDDEIATVDSAGVVDAVSPGSVTITCESESGKTATCRIVVEEEDSGNLVALVELNFNELTVRLGQTRQLMASVYPGGLDEEDRLLDWETLDRHVATVEEDGTVYGAGLGVTTIVVKSENGKTAVCRVTVTEDFDYKPGSSGNSGSGGKTPAVKPVADKIVGTLTTAAVRSEVERVAAATASGRFGTATFVDSGLITPELMTTAAAAAGSKNVQLRFAATGADKKRNGYLNLDPKVGRELKNSINTGVYTDGKEVASAEAIFDKYYQNETAAVFCTQPGSFGMSVTIQARANFSGMDTDNLVFYSYADNKVMKLPITAYSVDANGFLHFTTATGGMIIVSDGALVK
jgi:hypothetical protein